MRKAKSKDTEIDAQIKKFETNISRELTTTKG